MVEEDLFFPGKHINEGDDFIATDWNSISPDLNGLPPTRDDAFDPGSPETPTTNTTLLPRTPSRSNSPTHGPAEKGNGEVMVNGDQISCDSFPSPSLPVPTTITFPIMSKEQSPTSPLVETEPLYSESGTSPAGFGLSTISLSSTVNEAIMGRTRSSSVQTSTTISATTLNSAATLDSELKPTTKPSPMLLKMLMQTPTNPRDHTLLETIWNEMLSSRWVNSSPLSLLKTYLDWHFKGTVFFFPPRS